MCRSLRATPLPNLDVESSHLVVVSFAYLCSFLIVACPCRPHDSDRPILCFLVSNAFCLLRGGGKQYAILILAVWNCVIFDILLPSRRHLALQKARKSCVSRSPRS